MEKEEKVIKGLEEILDYFCDVYRNDTDSYKCEKAQEYSDVAVEAIALLKEQEPRKKGYWKYPQSLDCCCSECGCQPDHEPGESVPLYDYCPYCGAEMEVKYDD